MSPVFRKLDGMIKSTERKEKGEVEDRTEIAAATGRE